MNFIELSSSQLRVDIEIAIKPNADLAELVKTRLRKRNRIQRSTINTAFSALSLSLGLRGRAGRISAFCRARVEADVGPNSARPLLAGCGWDFTQIVCCAMEHAATIRAIEADDKLPATNLSKRFC